MAEIKRFTCGDLRLIPYSWPDGEWVLYSDHLAAIKAAVTAEREACAKLCDAFAKNSSNPMNFAENCAKAIRARGAAHE